MYPISPIWDKLDLTATINFLSAMSTLFSLSVLFLVAAKAAALSEPCESEIAAGIDWTATSSNGRVEKPCSSLFSLLRGGSVSRRCDNGVWSDIDFSSCLLPDNIPPFVLTWFTLDLPIENVSAESTTAELTNALQLGPLRLLTPVKLSVASLPFSSMTSVLAIMEFPDITMPSSIITTRIMSSLGLLSEAQSLGSASILSGRGYHRGSKGFYVSTSCPCQPSGQLFDSVCSGVIPIPPCLLVPDSANIRMCRNPEFVGDGTYCSRDVDEDGYPPVPIPSCFSNSTETYCTMDNCPSLYNPEQNVAICVAPRDFDGCPMQTGLRAGILWGNTARGSYAKQPCPAASEFATRYCTSNGEWNEEDVSLCDSYEFMAAFSSARDIFNLGDSVQDRLSMARSVMGDIATLTGSSSSYSLLPGDLDSTNVVVDELLDLLEETLTLENETDFNVLRTMDMLCSNIFDNVLEGSNLDGWLELTETGDGTPRLLDNMERYALFVSQRRSTGNTSQIWSRTNFALSFLKRPESSTSSIVFPMSTQQIESGLNFSYIPAQVQLPSKLFQSRGNAGGPSKMEVPSSIFVVRNMELAMPLAMESGQNASSIPSMIVSAQVNERGSPLPDIKDDPIQIMFQFDKVKDASDDQYKCAYWKFSDPIGEGYWAFDGVEKMSISEDSSGRMTVHCSSTHLTSFAVLVDVAGSTSNDPSSPETRALIIVSYIGCAISVLFLLATILFFLAQGRNVLIKMHYFIHLNLAISLCLAYVLFLVGGPTAIAIREACTAVAVVMHYLFLSAFCWMLCEGIMLYLLFIVVFTSVSQKPWLFLVIGYALPVVPVIISVGVRHDSYGVTNQDGNLTFCWLSTENGLIWAFVGPMLAIIMANLVFLSMAIYKVFTTKNKKRKNTKLKKKFSQSNMEAAKGNSNLSEDLKLAKSLIVSVIVLLPMLGLTWVLGVVAINRNTSVFAWIFTIVNSLQGFFIFFFHVVRNDKVWQNPRVKRVRSTLSRKSTNESSLHTSSTHYNSRTSTFTSRSYSLSNQYKVGTTKAGEMTKLAEAKEEEAKQDLSICSPHEESPDTKENRNSVTSNSDL